MQITCVIHDCFPSVCLSPLGCYRPASAKDSTELLTLESSHPNGRYISGEVENAAIARQQLPQVHDRGGTGFYIWYTGENAPYLLSCAKLKPLLSQLHRYRSDAVAAPFRPLASRGEHTRTDSTASNLAPGCQIPAGMATRYRAAASTCVPETLTRRSPVAPSIGA